jgi:putative acetyltransferase
MIRIDAIQPGQIADARRIIRTVCYEFFGPEPKSDEGLAHFCQQFEQEQMLADMDNLQQHYAAPHGAFLVLLDDERVVGTAALRRLDDETCELKRMWLLPPYRGLGWGRKMAQQLLDIAVRRGYKRTRLDTSPRQQQALRLYTKIGFQPIERYNDGPCEIFMEKQL